MADVFLSYVREDRPRAADVAAGLTRQGWTVWWDRRILPGHAFEREIAKQLADARCVVVLWSRTSVTSDWVRDEAAEATNHGKLIPVLIDDVTPPYGFRQYQNANLAGWTGDDSQAEFVLLVEGIELFAPRDAPKQEPSRKTLPGTQIDPASMPDSHGEGVEGPAAGPTIVGEAPTLAVQDVSSGSPTGQSESGESPVDAVGGLAPNSAHARGGIPTELEPVGTEALPVATSIVDNTLAVSSAPALPGTGGHKIPTTKPSPGPLSRVRLTRPRMASAGIALLVLAVAVLWLTGALSDELPPEATVLNQEPTAPKDEPTVLKDAVANVTREPENRRRIALLEREHAAGLGAYTMVRASLQSRGLLLDDALVNAVLVTPNFFEMFREQPVFLGSAFKAVDTQLLETVLSYKLWAEEYGRDPGMVGQSIKLNDSDYQVVGVARAGFDYPTNAELWTTTIHAATVSMPAVIRRAEK